MRRFELMSFGSLAPLPDVEGEAFLPSSWDVRVLAYLPRNHVLAGVIEDGAFDCWRLLSIRDGSWTPVGLSCDSPKELFCGGQIVKLEPQSVNLLLSELQGQIPPPYDAERAMAFLRDCLSRSRSPLSNTDSERRRLLWAFCGTGAAMMCGDMASLSRIGLWFRDCREAFEGFDLKLWRFIVPSFPEDFLQEVEALGFPKDRVRQLDLEDSNPSVMRSRKGYLIHYWNGVADGYSDIAPVRLLLYAPPGLWSQMRGLFGLTLKEMIYAAWGYSDCQEAWRNFRFYRFGDMVLKELSPV
ncbi:hypothetical protein TheveDRAFT_0209 [Thermanaerovibrio velox DSM 12556]|uniref:Uncharacterized protein n=1 Tax=Thermanaerovibrio velox DSM 12556 TaxID=926567 RepID=H0UNI5_9BACT|nr:hypothetical protein [Thermanaerovibrio velox]EHM09392.1 hypothetical protein TheveDRAFT_0209 [Thermanaerovibrio velox DSM 12556]